MEEIQSREARDRWSDLLDRAEWRGETFQIVRSGKPVALVTPIPKMTLYRIARTGSDQAATYDAAEAFVIAAPNEQRTRELAAESARDESSGLWLDTRRTAVTPIGVANPDQAEGVILADIHEA